MGVKERKEESVWTRRRIKGGVWELKKGRKKVYEREEE